MDIKVLGIDLGKPFAVLPGWMKRERLCFANGSRDIGCWTFSIRFRPAWLRWKPAAGRITLGAFAWRRGMSPG